MKTKILFSVLALVLIGSMFSIIGALNPQQQVAQADGQTVRGLYYWTTTRCSTGQTSCNTLAQQTKDSESGTNSNLIFHYGAGQTPNQLQIDTLKSMVNTASQDFTCYQIGMQGVSLAQLQTLAPIVKQNFKDAYSCSQGPWLGYNLESGLSPASEVSDPIGSFTTAKSIADANGLRLLAAPSRAISNVDNNLVGIAGKVGLYNLQVAGIQGTSETDCSTLASEVDNRVDLIRATYPTKQITFQTSLTRTGATVNLIENCMDETYTASTVYGATVWWNGATIDNGDWKTTMTYWETQFPSQ